MKLSKKQQEQLKDQNLEVDELLKIIEAGQTEEGKLEVRVFIGFDNFVEDSTLEILGEKLEIKNLKVTGDSELADEHQGHLGRFLCYLDVKETKGASVLTGALGPTGITGKVNYAAQQQGDKVISNGTPQIGNRTGMIGSMT